MRVPPSFIRFSIVGALNTAVDVGIFSILSVMGWNLFVANLTSTTVGLSLSFVLNHHFTFNSQGDKRKQIIPFLVVTLCGLWVLQPAVIFIVTHVISARDSAVLPIAAKVVATGGSLIWNYIWYSKKIFKSYAS